MEQQRSPHVVDLHDRPSLLGHAPPPPSHLDDPHLRRHHHISALKLKDGLATIDCNIQSLLLDNQSLAAIHVALALPRPVSIALHACSPFSANNFKFTFFLSVCHKISELM